MSEKKISEEVVLHLRGFFATPLLSSLGRSGILDRVLTLSNFSAEDFGDVPNTILLHASFVYFMRIGLLEEVEGGKDRFRTTDLGKRLFQRAPSYYVPHSYYRYLIEYHNLLHHPTETEQPETDRLENIIGSGATHLRYFPSAISFLKRKAIFDVLVDIGCGNGGFLSAFMDTVPGKKAIGVDISPVSVDESAKALSKRFPDRFLSTVRADALDVERWSRQVIELAESRPIAISMWFLLHEISRNNPRVIVDYLVHLNEMFPSAPVVICDLVRHPYEILAATRETTIMPEYLFFHDLSGQGILSWEQYQDILSDIPYKPEKEYFFDELPYSADTYIPSAFIWCLKPSN